MALSSGGIPVLDNTTAIKDWFLLRLFCDFAPDFQAEPGGHAFPGGAWEREYSELAETQHQ